MGNCLKILLIVHSLFRKKKNENYTFIYIKKTKQKKKTKKKKKQKKKKKKKTKGILFWSMLISADIFLGMVDIPDIFAVWLLYRIFLRGKH